MSSWLKDRGSIIGAIAGTIAAFVAVLLLFVVSPMNQRFDAMERHLEQRFDAQDQRLDRLTDEVSALRQLTASISERVSRNEGQIDVIRGQMQTVDAP